MYRILGKTTVGFQELIENYPPKYESERKKQAFSNALRFHRGDIGEVSICRIIPDRTTIKCTSLEKKPLKLTVDEEFYDYTKTKADSDIWFVNFADPVLFVAYDSDMFAQDEIQTLEMPLLASCCLYLDEKKYKGLVTRTNIEGVPTPYLFRNIPYWISVNTKPLLKDGSSGNIYGNAFMYADDEEIEAGISTFEEDVRCNILAMAAPEGGVGRYEREELRELLYTLLCSFSAVRKQSKVKAVIHSGNWGCGAFGGNKELMYLAQMYAASVCGIDELVLHAPNEEILERAKRMFSLLPDEACFSGIEVSLYVRDYEWGSGDGN